jgi:hypothetical protein
MLEDGSELALQKLLVALVHLIRVVRHYGLLLETSDSNLARY